MGEKGFQFLLLIWLPFCLCNVLVCQCVLMCMSLCVPMGACVYGHECAFDCVCMRVCKNV